MGVALGDGLACWDLDGCLVDGRLTPEGAALLDGIADPLFVEVSQSGRGLHVFVAAPEGPARVRPGVEFYARQRFIACTGVRFVREV